MNARDTKAIVMAILLVGDRLRGTLWDLQPDREDGHDPLPYEYDTREQVSQQADQIMEAAS